MLLKIAQYAALNFSTQRMVVMGNLRPASGAEIPNAKHAELVLKGRGLPRNSALRLATLSTRRNLEHRNTLRRTGGGSLGRILRHNVQSMDARRIEIGAPLFSRGTTSHARNVESEEGGFRRTTSCHFQRTQSCVMFCRTEEHCASIVTGKPRHTDGGHIGLSARRNSSAKRMAQEVLAL